MSLQKDPENKETVLDELSVLKNKVEMLMTANKWDEAFPVSQRGVEIAEKYMIENPGNAMAIVWVGYFYERQIEILKTQGKTTQNQERIIREMHRKHLEIFKSPTDFRGYGL